MVDLNYFDRWYNKSLDWHKSLGMLVLGMGLLKTGWQLYSPTPDTIVHLQYWQRIGANITHKLLLASMILVPLSGYLISTSDGSVVDIFDWFEFPALVPVNAELRDLAIALHYYLAYATGFLVLGHVAAALKHQFIDKDALLARMLWRE